MYSVCLCVLLVLCLYIPARPASMTECQVRCPPGMVCTRLAGSNFHLCIRRSSLNYTMSADEIVEHRAEEDEPRVEGRADGPGLCPRPSIPSGPCVVQCRYHSDCRPRQACCSNGCGHTCVSVTPSRVTKPGSCPLVSRLDTEPCGSRCESDGDCPGQRKCCRSRCGVSCRAPCFHWLTNTRINPWRLSHRCSEGMAQSWD